MLIDVPGMSAGRTDSLSSSIDLGPTLMDLCEIKPFAGIQGHSLAPILADAETEVRDHVLVEDDLPDITAQLTPFPGKTRTLVTRDYRFTRNIKGEEQLFDLNADRDEMTDLKKSDQRSRAEMVERMMVALIEADESVRGAPVA